MPEKTTIIAKINKLQIQAIGLLSFQGLVVWCLAWYMSKQKNFTFLLIYPVVLGVSLFGLVGYFRLFKLKRAGLDVGYKVHFWIPAILLCLCVLSYFWSRDLYIFLQQWYPEGPFGGL